MASAAPAPDAEADERPLLPPASPRAPELLLDDDGAPLDSSPEHSPDGLLEAASVAPPLEHEDAAFAAQEQLPGDGDFEPLPMSGGALGVTAAAGDEASEGTLAAHGSSDLSEALVSGPGAPDGGQMELTSQPPEPEPIGSAAASAAPAPTAPPEEAAAMASPQQPAAPQVAQQPASAWRHEPGRVMNFRLWGRGAGAAGTGSAVQQAQQQAQQSLAMQQTGGAQGVQDAGSAVANLRAMQAANRMRPKQYAFDGKADADELPREIDEFYSYVEAPQIAENRAAWEEWCETGGAPSAAQGEGESDERKPRESEPDGGALGLGLGPGTASGKASPSEWTSQPSSSRRRAISLLLSQLEVRDPATRQRASRALLYLLQGAFADTSGTEHQLQWMGQNARMVRNLGGVEMIYGALRLAGWKHDWLSALPDHILSSTVPAPGEPPVEPLLTPQAKLDYLDEINLELALHFAQLYILVETARGEEEWGDELMSLDPPMPIYLFGLVASLREKNAKGYPVKKLLLLLWKSILCCMGGSADIDRCKKLARELEGLRDAVQPAPRLSTKATPLDFQAFQEEITVKYPTFEQPRRAPGELPTDKIASAVSPIPVRRPLGQADSSLTSANGANGSAPGAPGNGPFPGTPAPSPPPSPKPNKQKYQTDQNRPFVFPYSRSVQGARLVPFSIDEAGRLFRENMHVSLELWQTWRLREQCIHEESGVGSNPDGQRVGLGVAPARSTPPRKGSSDSSGASGGAGPSLLTHGAAALSPLSRLDRTGDDGSSGSGSRSPSSVGAPLSHTTERSRRAGPNGFKLRGEPTLERLQELESDIEAELTRAEADHMLAVLDNPRYMANVASLRQQRADTRRLQRVDAFYRAVLPQLQNGVVVLLKLLLATVTQQSSTNSPHAQAVAEGMAPDDTPPPTLEDIDIVRHREITSKAVSAILLLCLQWFKASHAMKFHYLSQLLVDSNCLLLILKMFGLQEVGNTVRAQNEAPNFNFFRYCELNCGQEMRQPQPEDALPGPQYGIGLGGRAGSPPPLGGVANLGVKGEEIEYVTNFSFRNLFSALHFTRILQKLTKRKVHRVLLLVQYKSSAILKRTLKVPHPALQRYALKVIKSQVPFCGRKWRQSNMKVITAIYLNLRPDLREDWLSGGDVDAEVEESLPQEQALRGLVKYYNASRFSPPVAAGPPSAGQGHGHRRSLSTNLAEGLPQAAPGQEGGAGGLGQGAGAANGLHPPMSPGRQMASFFETDILPPLRRNAEGAATSLRYSLPDELLDGYLDEYDDVLSEVFGGEGTLGDGWSSGKWGLTQDGSQTAWARLGEILGEAESISDSESVGTIDLHMEGSGAAEGASEDDLSAPPPPEGAQSWENLSPKEMRFLAAGPGSPAARRRSSSSAGSGPLSRSNSDSAPLRPVLSFGPELLEDEVIQDDDEGEQVAEEPPVKPQAGGIDEVEHIWAV